MISKIIMITVTVILVLGLPLAALAGQNPWVQETLAYGDEVLIEERYDKMMGPPPVYVTCDEFEPYRNWCDEEAYPYTSPSCDQGMVKNLDDYGMSCHARMAYWSSILDERVVLDWYYSDDETIYGDYDNSVVGWRPCDYIQGGNIIHKTEGYKVNWEQGYHAPWRPLFTWNRKCDPPIKLLIRYDSDSPTYCEFFGC